MLKFLILGCPKSLDMVRRNKLSLV